MTKRQTRRILRQYRRHLSVLYTRHGALVASGAFETADRVLETALTLEWMLAHGERYLKEAAR